MNRKNRMEKAIKEMWEKLGKEGEAPEFISLSEGKRVKVMLQALINNKEKKEKREKEND